MGITTEEQEDRHHCQTMLEFSVSLKQYLKIKSTFKLNLVHCVYNIAHKDVTPRGTSIVYKCVVQLERQVYVVFLMFLSRMGCSELIFPAGV